MPYVNVQILEGATRPQKAALVADMTDALVRILDKKPEHIHVVIQEIPFENWGFLGRLTDELAARPATKRGRGGRPKTPTKPRRAKR
jgi:4-oxalocrotonate tautomerase